MSAPYFQPGAAFSAKRGYDSSMDIHNVVKAFDTRTNSSDRLQYIWTVGMWRRLSIEAVTMGLCDEQDLNSAGYIPAGKVQALYNEIYLLYNSRLTDAIDLLEPSWVWMGEQYHVELVHPPLLRDFVSSGRSKAGVTAEMLKTEGSKARPGKK